MRALIDGDILVYRVAWASENDNEAIAEYRMRDCIDRIMYETKANDFTVYLTSQDKSNFRYALDPEYKSNRKQPKPRFYLEMRNLLINEYKAKVIEGMEADDAIGTDHTLGIEESMIVTIDKDLDQIPGDHYNFVKLRRYMISPLEAARSFYAQMLVGDRSDNVKGCPGIGEVKSLRMLEGCESEEEMFFTVLDQYVKAYDRDAPEKLWLAGNLLWIRRFDGDNWSMGGEAVSKGRLKRLCAQRGFYTDMSQDDTSTLSQSTPEPTPLTGS